MKFIDQVTIRVASGHGGAGAVSFRREAMVPRGGPDGGDGGRGGDLILKAVSSLNSLVDFRYNKKYSAQNGQPGGGSDRTGADGQSLVLLVPKGTVVRDKLGRILVDMTGIEEHVLLRGGRGGKGNAYFKTSVNQAPETAQPGEPDQVLEISLELKLIADIGIIGLPNAGKSTLISRISAAKPKIADYPFTTLTPNLGVVKLGEFRSFVVADIPGLIKDAHKGIGLGTQFLRHVERTRAFVHLIDVSGYPDQDPSAAYQEIIYELEMYDKMNQGKEGFFPICGRKQVIVFNKIDVLSAELLERAVVNFKRQTGVSPLAVSAVSGKNIDKLLIELESIVMNESSEV